MAGVQAEIGGRGAEIEGVGPETFRQAGVGRGLEPDGGTATDPEVIDADPGKDRAIGVTAGRASGEVAVGQLDERDRLGPQ